MASWFEGILEIDDIYDYQYDHNETFMVRTKNIDKFKYYAECLTEYIVFRYVYVDTTSNEYNKDKFMIFKNCFVTGVVRESTGGFIINFYYGEKIKKDEIMIVLRGIKLNKLKQKLKSTI
jgi:hypothetical protein